MKKNSKKPWKYLGNIYTNNVKESLNWKSLYYKFLLIRYEKEKKAIFIVVASYNYSDYFHVYSIFYYTHFLYSYNFFL